MSTLLVGLSARFECASKIQGPQFLNDICHVIVKITTYKLFSRLKIAVENLNVFVAELQLSPTKISAKCLH